MSESQRGDGSDEPPPKVSEAPGEMVCYPAEQSVSLEVPKDPHTYIPGTCTAYTSIATDKKPAVAVPIPLRFSRRVGVSKGLLEKV